MTPSRWTVVLCSSVLAACVSTPTPPTEAEKPDTQAESERLKEFVLSEAPSDLGAPLNVNFEDKVTLLGARIEPAGAVRVGQKLKFTLYWKVLQKLPAGWKLFTHIADASGARLLNIDNVGPLRELRGGKQALGPSDWEVGKVYADEQTFTVPGKAKTDTIQILTGIFSKHVRLEITSGPHDSTRRAIVASLPVSGGHPGKNAHIPTLNVEKLEPNTAIKLDGKLDEPAWKTAASTGPLVDVRTGEPNQALPVNGDVKVLWSDAGIYVGFSVADTDIIGGFKKGDQDPHLWTRDTIEMMVDPDGDGDNKDYYEIQINPQNLVFDSQFDAYNEPKTEPDGPFGHQEWSANLKSAVALDGTVDKSTDEDRGYTVEAMIPWKSFSKAKTLPPELGSSWRVNFYAMKNNGGVAWSPILGQGNFHKATRFGRIVWTKKGAPEAASSAAAPVHSGAPSGSAGTVSSAVKSVPAPPLKIAPAPAASK